MLLLPVSCLNNSAIRGIAFGWLPNKATQSRVNIDSSKSARGSLWWHHISITHGDNNTRPPVTVLAGRWHTGEGKSWRERERRDDAHARLAMLSAGWCCRLALVLRLLMGWVNSALPVAVTHPHIRQSGAVSCHLCSHSDDLSLWASYSSSGPSAQSKNSFFFFCSDWSELNRKNRKSIKVFAPALSSHQAALKRLVALSIIQYVENF